VELFSMEHFSRVKI